jgi:signal transduction histidine kinase
MDTTREALDAHISTVETSIEIDIDGGFDPFAQGRVFFLVTPEIGLQILSAQGEPLAISENLKETSLIPVDEVVASGFAERELEIPGYGNALVRAEAFDTSQATFVIEAVSSLSELDKASLIMFGVAPIGAVAIAYLVGLGVFWSVGAALGPVRQISERAALVADSGRPEPLNVPADTAELKELSSHLDHLLERIRRSFDREQQFLDDASHELRTPIAIARAELDLARRVAADAGTRAALDSSIEELRRLDGMASDLLVLARERAAGTGGRISVDLIEIAHNAVDAVQRDPRQTPVHMEIRGSGVMSGDPASLERALLNLIANAAQHCEHSVEIDVTDSTDALVITVTDDGPGIPDHLIDNLFDRFARGRNLGAHSTGLGTAIAAEVVRHHGGTVKAENGLERGAVVTIRFPKNPGSQ